MLQEEKEENPEIGKPVGNNENGFREVRKEEDQRGNGGFVGEQDRGTDGGQQQRGHQPTKSYEPQTQFPAPVPLPDRIPGQSAFPDQLDEGIKGIKPCSFYIEQDKKLANEIKEELKSKGPIDLSFPEFLRKMVEARKVKGLPNSPPCLPSYSPSTAFLYSYWNLHLQKRQERGFRGSLRKFSNYLGKTFSPGEPKSRNNKNS